jgi:hypothetical protein
MTGYFVLRNGDASLARSGSFAMTRPTKGEEECTSVWLLSVGRIGPRRDKNSLVKTYGGLVSTRVLCFVFCRSARAAR